MKIPIRSLAPLMALPLVCAAPAIHAQQVLPREDFKVFSQDATKLQKLRDAVQAVKARHLDDSTSWFTVAGIHEISNSDPDLHHVPDSLKELFHQCHNDSALFFLWHRAYVASLEKLLQDAINDPDFRLPYWNWYADPALPEAFRVEFLDTAKTIANPLYVKNRNPNANAGKPLWKPSYVTNYDENNFDTFQGDLEGEEHGDIHVYIGTFTNMGQPNTAARDPIFFLHHANIDRLLMCWLNKDKANHHAPTSFPNWQDTDYRFPVPPAVIGGGAPHVHTPTVLDLALGSMEAMGYKYDNVDLPPLTPPPPPPPAPPHLVAAGPAVPGPAGAPKIMFAASKGIDLAKGVTLQLSIHPDNKQKMMAMADIKPVPKSEAGLTVVFENIKLKDVPPTLSGYKVYVDLPKEGQNAAADKDHYVGKLSIFSLQHSKNGTTPKVSFKISPQRGAAALKKNLTASGGENKVNISLVPVMGLDAAGNDAAPPEKTVLTIGEVRLEGQQP